MTNTNTRKVEFDLEAVVLAAFCVFLWLSLLSYDPADMGGSLPRPFSGLLKLESAVYPPNEQPSNWCGWWGAVVAQLMVQGLGIGSLLVATGLSVLALWMFRVQSNYVRASRQFGWLLVVVAATTLVSLLRWSTPLSSVIGSGGYLGAMVSTWLNEHFAVIGSLILTTTVLIAGLLLSTDYMFVRAAAWMLLGGATVAKTTASATRKRIAIPVGIKDALAAPRRRASDVDLGVQLPAAESNDAAVPASEPTIKIRGQQLDGTSTSTTAASGAATSGAAASSTAPVRKEFSRVPSRLLVRC